MLRCMVLLIDYTQFLTWWMQGGETPTPPGSCQLRVYLGGGAGFSVQSQI